MRGAKTVMLIPFRTVVCTKRSRSCLCRGLEWSESLIGTFQTIYSPSVALPALISPNELQESEQNLGGTTMLDRCVTKF